MMRRSRKAGAMPSITTQRPHCQETSTSRSKAAASPNVSNGNSRCARLAFIGRAHIEARLESLSPSRVLLRPKLGARVQSRRAAVLATSDAMPPSVGPYRLRPVFHLTGCRPRATLSIRERVFNAPWIRHGFDAAPSGVRGADGHRRGRAYGCEGLARRPDLDHLPR